MKLIAKIANEGLNPVKKIHSLLGGWPVVEKEWQNVRWQNVLTFINEYGFPINPLVSVYVGDDFKNTTQKIIQV